MIKDTTCIVRTIGERTTDICCNRLASMGLDPLQITGKPFNRTLVNAYKKAIAYRNKYTIMVDADVIPTVTHIDDFIEFFIAGKYEMAMMEIECFVFGCVRFGGIKIYKTPVLKEYKGLLDSLSYRPEAAINHILDNGRFGKCFGTHGYQQYYQDIWRTFFFHGIKSKDNAKFKESMINMQQKCILGKDKDTIVAYAAASAGGEYKNAYGYPEIDYKQFKLKEKEPMTQEEIST
jgi:hypothetical protein